MDDEEEIDIIGNYDDISKITSGQLLSCDYTVHPKWVNENAEGGNFWSDSVPKHENLENNVEVLHSEEVVIEEPESVPKNILDLGWEGEIASQNDDVVFEDDIPATIEEVIDDEECEEEEEEAFDPVSQEIKSQEIYHSSSGPEWDETVAAFETHPAPKNNKYIGPTNSRSLLKVKIDNPIIFSSNPRSLLKINNFPVHNNEKKTITKFKQTLIISSSSLFEKRNEKRENKSENDTKFKQSIKIQNKNLDKFKRKTRVSNNKSNEKNLKQKIKDKAIITAQHKKGGKVKKATQSVIHFGENITINHDPIVEPIIPIENVNKDKVISSETFVKLQNTESDVEIDIEADLSEDEMIDLKKSLFPSTLAVKLESKDNKISNSIIPPQPASLDSDQSSIRKRSKRKDSNVEQSNIKISDELEFEIRNSMEMPKQELILSANEVTDLEKYFNIEFFDGRSTSKNPEQYLRIRNHILTMWNVMGKNGYVSKTSVRNGLKHGGDVNCISRVHRLLEQIGAINFGYQGKYFEYVRPLEEYFSMFMQTKLSQVMNSAVNESIASAIISTERKPRTRTRTNYFALENCIESDEDDINYTIEHMEGVYRPDAPALNSEHHNKEIRHIRTELDLVKCLKFSQDNIAPFKVSITLSTLLCIQLHSLSSHHEVMGFLGGHRSKSVGRNKLSLTRYKPCKTSEQSGTMCEMCPVSQVEQSASLKSEGHELLGWFHSHPLFPPNPSRTDVQTQIEMQMQFSAHTDRTFIGLILSCINMSFKCMYIMPKDYSSNLNDMGSPYEIDVDIIKDCTNFKFDIKDVLNAIESTIDCHSNDGVIEKFKISSETILKQFGYNTETFFVGVL